MLRDLDFVSAVMIVALTTNLHTCLWLGEQTGKCNFPVPLEIMVEGLQSGQSKISIELEIAKKGLEVVEILKNWTKYFMLMMDTLKSLDIWQ
jgi:hypothetical protein